MRYRHAIGPANNVACANQRSSSSADRPGSGKTTLAHELAHAIGCPAICRDEIKEGMVHAHGPFEAAWGDELTQRTFPLFFEVLTLLARAGVTVVGEAAFQHFNWEPNLAPFADLAHVRVIRCRTDPGTARARVEGRGHRTAHADGPLLAGLDAAICTTRTSTTSGRRYDR